MAYYLRYFLTRHLTFGSILLFSQLCMATNHVLHGYISDERTGEKLIGTYIYIPSLNIGTVSNHYGFYSISIPQDSVDLYISYIGYKTQICKVFLNTDSIINFSLPEESIDLDEVEITENYSNYDKPVMSLVKLPVKRVKLIPALLGETDILKSLQLIPGVGTGTDGSVGLYVRGGSPDQNLILLDGLPVYNVFHAFGLFSVFNPEAIHDVTLIKGAFPARYGGRLSSVLDIKMKEGNLKNIEKNFTIGLLASSFTVQGPIKKDTSSFIVSARRSYIDLFVAPAMKYFEDRWLGYGLHDINLKLNHRFSHKNKIYLSAYMGQDKFYNKHSEKNSESKINFSWGNLTGLFRWNHLINKSMFSNISLSYSQYKYSIGDYYKLTIPTEKEVFGYERFSGIQDIRITWDIDILPNNKHYIKVGTCGMYNFYNPSGTSYFIENTDTAYEFTFTNKSLSSKQFAVYIEDEYSFSKKINANLGIRYSGYSIDEKYYGNIEPRISVNYKITNSWVFKSSYSSMDQYIHLLSNYGLGIPTDLWVPATNLVPPQSSQQVALGIYHFLNKNTEISLESYYKYFNNIIEYRDGASYLDNKYSWETKVESGKGEAYGVEFFVNKTMGKFNGWIAYTLSWNNRQFKEINFGEPFPYKFNNRHDFSIVLSYKLSDKITFSGNWVYKSGYNISLPTALYESFVDKLHDFVLIDNETIWYYEKRNGFKLPSYHRLDVGITFNKKTNKKERNWIIGVYNVYNKKNIFYISDKYVTTAGGDYIIRWLLPIIPSVSYNLKF